MTTEQSLEFVRRQKEQEKERHDREKLALEQRKTAENQKYQNNIQRLRQQKQNLLNSQQIRSYNEYFDRIAKHVERINKLFDDVFN